MRALLLGTSDAWPLPRPACGCDQCVAAREDAKERRTRSGLLLETHGGRVLFDANPDIVHQLEREGLEPRVDRVVISHHHYDHILGLYDLCRVRTNQAVPLPVHANAHTTDVLTRVFPPLLRAERPAITLEPWGTGQRIDLGDALLEGFETHHRADVPTTALLLHLTHGGATRRIAYATDMGSARPSPADRLTGVDLFVGDGTCLGGPGHGHAGTDRVLAIARKLGARRTALTHVGHWGLHPAASRQVLPADVAICRDGDDLLSLLA